MNRNYDVKPIPTTYNEVTFKSRLEARWAVFFDVLGVEWLYEYEGYQLESGWYVPDFWLPQFKTWVEIKPSKPTELESQQCSELARVTGYQVLLEADGLTLPDERTTDGAWIYEPGGYGDQPIYWCICSECGRVGFKWMGSGDRICGVNVHGGKQKEYTHDDSRIMRAYRIAQKHNFQYMQVQEKVEEYQLPPHLQEQLDRLLATGFEKTTALIIISQRRTDKAIEEFNANMAKYRAYIEARGDTPIVKRDDTDIPF